MIDPLQLAEDVVKKLKKDFDDVSAIITWKNSVMIKLWNTEPSVTQSWINTEATVYVAKNRKTLQLSLSIQDPEKIVERVSNSIPALHRLEESELYAPLPEPKAWKPLGGLIDKAVINAIDSPKEPAQEMIDAALKEGAERVAGTLTLNHAKRAVVTNKGFSGFEEGTSVEAYLRAFKGLMSGHWGYGSRHLDLRAIRDVGSKAGYFATITPNKVDYEPGKYDVILSPLVIGNLMNYVGFMASAAAVLMGYSMFAKFKPGDLVGNYKLTLEDIPRDPELPSSAAFDDEGTPTYNKPIIEKGILKNLLHNSGTARKMQAKPTGNAGLTFPTPWNLRISTGELSDDNLPKELGNGLIINNNWYTRLQNYVEGIFSTVSRDACLLVKNGEIVGDVGRVRVADRMDRVMKNIVDFGKNLYLIRWWEVRTPIKAPYILIKDVNITKPFA